MGNGVRKMGQYILWKVLKFQGIGVWERWSGEKGGREGFVVDLKVFVDVYVVVCGLDRLRKIFKNLANVCLKNSPSVPKNRHLKT